MSYILTELGDTFGSNKNSLPNTTKNLFTPSNSMQKMDTNLSCLWIQSIFLIMDKIISDTEPYLFSVIK